MERDNVRALNNNLASHADVLRASSRVPRPEHLLKRTATSIRFPTLGKLVFAMRNITREKIADFKVLSAVLISETFGIRKLIPYQTEATVQFMQKEIVVFVNRIF